MENDAPVKVFIGLVLSIVVLIVLVAISPFTVVGAGERSVITYMGKVDRVLGPGLHGVVPLVESVHSFNVQTQVINADANASSKDLQDVSTTIALNYNVNPETVAGLYADVGEDFVSRIIEPAIQESVKAATAKYTAEELVTKRDVVKSEIQESMSKRLSPLYIKVTGLSITNFNFSESFNQSIEEKVKAEQDALTAKNKLEQVKYEADQRVAQAQAEAEAIKIQAQAINSTGGKDYVALKAIEKWSGVLPITMVPNGALPFIDVQPSK